MNQKILLLIGLPLYGIFINYLDQGLIALLLNPVSTIIMSILNLPFFYNQTMFQYEWIIHPTINVISNLIFWIPMALFINRILKQRKMRLKK
jgi:hypothetical protein